MPLGGNEADADFDTLGELTGAKTATPSAHAVTSHSQMLWMSIPDMEAAHPPEC